MYGNDNFSSWLLIPSRPDDFLFSSLDMYLPSSETEKYGMINGTCPLVFCLQKSCREFEHSYTFVLGSFNDSLTQTGNDYLKHLKKWRDRKSYSLRKERIGCITKPGHCVLCRRAKCPCFHPHTLQSRLKVFFLSFFFPGDEAETGRTEVFNGYMVCQHLSFQSS